jgi:hypothetical protein
MKSTGIKMISVLDKQDSVGGTGGHVFDSGCNPSGLRKVRIELNAYHYKINNKTFPSLIRRIFLEFNNHPTDSNLDTKQERHPQYVGFTGKPNDKLCTFDLVDPNDPLVKVNVWSDDICVTGVNFILKSGTISQLNGFPSESDTLTTFEGQNGSAMVGIHGRYGTVIDRLGITFAKTIRDDLGFPPNSNDDASTLQKEMESSCSVKTNTKDKEEDDDESSTDVNDEPGREGKDVCDIISLDEPKEGHHKKEMKSSCSVESSCSVTINAKEEKDDDESWADVHDGSMDRFFV